MDLSAVTAGNTPLPDCDNPDCDDSDSVCNAHASLLSSRGEPLAEASTAELNQSLYGLANVKVLQAEFREAEALYLEALERLQASEDDVRPEIIDNRAGRAELASLSDA